MQRITISLDEDLLAMVDGLCRRRGYTSRSEAVRDILRGAAVQAEETAAPTAACYGVLSYVYDHETRDLARRLTESHHHDHALSVSTLHVHVSDRDCLEVAILRGRPGELQRLADAITTQRGVRFGALHVVPSDGEAASSSHHAHAGHGHGHGHS